MDERAKPALQHVGKRRDEEHLRAELGHSGVGGDDVHQAAEHRLDLVGRAGHVVEDLGLFALGDRLAKQPRVGADDEERIPKVVREALQRGDARFLEPIELAEDALDRLGALLLHPRRPLELPVLERDDLGARLRFGLADLAQLGARDRCLLDASEHLPA